MRELVAFAEATFGGVDVLVNNASAPRGGDNLEDRADALQTDLLGAIYAARWAIDAMRRRGGGAIVWEPLTAAQRAERGVPARLLTPDEIAHGVKRLADDVSLAGRVLVWWSDDEPKLIRWGDRGYRDADGFPLSY
jgi:hypothetical protein